MWATVNKVCNLLSNKDHSQPRSNLYSFFIITVLYKINRPCHTINDPDLLIEDLLLTSTFCYNKPLTYMLLLFHSCSQRHTFFLKFIVSLSFTHAGMSGYRTCWVWLSRWALNDADDGVGAALCWRCTGAGFTVHSSRFLLRHPQDLEEKALHLRIHSALWSAKRHQGKW